MRFSSSGFILNFIKKGEKSALVNIFTPNYGLITGYVKNIYNKNKVNIFNTGNIARFHSYSREGGLKSIIADGLEGGLACCLHNKTAFNIIIALACAMNSIMAVQEDNVHSNILYESILKLISSISVSNDDKVMIADFLLWMKSFYGFIGFGLDTEKCAATATTIIKHLTYLSPKTGRAVCSAAGEPYKNILLALPEFFITGNVASVESEDLKNAFKIIDKFFIKIAINLHLKEPYQFQDNLRTLEKQIIN